jgi:alpha-beta hydrolase superfamily lysophospholipase
MILAAKPEPSTPPDAVTADAERRVPGMSPTMRRRVRVLFRGLTLLSPALAARVAAYFFVRPRSRPVTPSEAQFLGGARARRLATPEGGIQLYEWPAAGPMVLVVHGWISHAGRLQPLIEALHAQGLHVLAFDAPAHGRSGGREADLHRYRAAISAVSRACGPVAAVVAHSFGAMATVSWLAEDAAAASVRAAVLVGLPRDVGYLFESFAIVLGLRPDVLTRLRRLFHERYGRFPEEFSALTLARAIHIPVLLVHGAQDDLVPVTHADEIVEELVGGRLQVVQELNHSAPLRDPATVALMAGYLAERLKSSDARTAPAP